MSKYSLSKTTTVPNPQQAGDFRPISLCNVFYKLLAKVLVNRLCVVLGDQISQFQNGFVPSRLISDNVFVAHEILEHIRKRKKGQSALYALKLDMNKAYDRVDMDFLLGILRVMGFSLKWIGWILQCVSTVSFSVLVNGRKSRTFVPTCGLRQGDLLLPCLFILVAQAVSDGLGEFASNNICRGRLSKDKVRYGVLKGRAGGRAQVLCFEHNKSGLEVD
ncbi:hypothetical protein RHSIM_Rhsim05G0098600 [Rhododendron simsii]|uniref:Reverse transcriptase domain-containing protein n=1 Tax=Rhododendron simsii TaxID=118357 RepID=A0A834GZH7_RHOSS|nr:hypothetical protein RHSIM_Rhsim05G0098600 [Rhododendron simsii]